MNDIPPLPWLRAFEAASRNGNFSSAGDELGLTPAAISHQVRALEEHLGYQLFSREKRPMELTAMGELYLPWVIKAFETLRLGTRDVFGTRDTRPLRIRLPADICAGLDAEAVARFPHTLSGGQYATAHGHLGECDPIEPTGYINSFRKRGMARAESSAFKSSSRCPGLSPGPATYGRHTLCIARLIFDRDHRCGRQLASLLPSGEPPPSCPNPSAQRGPEYSRP